MTTCCPFDGAVNIIVPIDLVLSKSTQVELAITPPLEGVENTPSVASTLKPFLPEGWMVNMNTCPGVYVVKLGFNDNTQAPSLKVGLC
jgi:hypothetical protein